MKKFAILFASLVAVFAMSSCKEDKEPTYQEAFGLSLNTPPLADQYFVLTPDGTIDLTWSQPNWGFAAAAEYVVEVSLQEDFHYFENGTYNYVFTLPTVYTSCASAISMAEIATGISEISPVQDEDKFNALPAQTIYLRVHGYIPEIYGSDVYSNPICLKQVKAYFAKQLPGKIYLVGSPEGWKGPEEGNADHYADWALYEKDDAIGSKVYYGSFSLGAAPMFRFYTALTGWDKDSWGSQEADNPLNFDLVGGAFSGAINGPGWKGAYNFPNFGGGDVDIMVDLEAKYWTMKVK